MCQCLTGTEEDGWQEITCDDCQRLITEEWMRISDMMDEVFRRLGIDTTP